MIERIPTAEFIRDELEARGWTQAEFAAVMGRPVGELLSGHEPLSPETAIGLGEAFGTSPDLWLNLDRAYREGREGGSYHD